MLHTASQIVHILVPFTANPVLLEIEVMLAPQSVNHIRIEWASAGS